ncbi:SusD family protein [compost metagenome]
MKRVICKVLLLILLFSVSSCKKWLDLQPQDGIIRNEFWKTKEDVQAAVIGCYSSLLGAPGGIKDRPLADYLFIWGELRADMVSPGPGITIDEQNIMNVNILSSNVLTTWKSLYRTINYCNTVIDFAPDVREVDNTFTQASLDAYMAEALALRSLMYFYVVRTWGDAPLKLKSTSTDQEIQNLGITDKTVILNQIVADLLKAESLAVTTYGNKQYDTGRITKYTIETMLADVYLWMENYNDCIAMCDKVIDSKKFSLVPGEFMYNRVFYEGNSTEGIFEFQFDAQKLNQFYNAFIPVNRRYNAANRVLEEMYTIDFTDETKFDFRGIDAAVRAKDIAIYKYMGIDYNTARTADVSYAHWFAYRYPDVLLMKAEACSQVDRGQDALDLVKVVRDRANALIATAQNPDVTDKDAVADYVLAERAREFAFEGKRWYDILRNAKRDNYRRIDVLLNMVAESVPSDAQQSAITKYQDKNSHYLPIFDDEISADGTLKQNPFYK